MDPATAPDGYLVLQGLAAIAILIVLAGVIIIRFRTQAGGYWIMGWGTLLMAGALFLGESMGYSSLARLAFVADALFAPLMLMGALDLGKFRPAPLWPLTVGLLAGLARVGLSLIDSEIGQVLHSVAVAPAFLMAAAIVTLRTDPAATFRVPIASLLVVLVGFEFVDAWMDSNRGQNQVNWKALLVICVPLAGFQVASRLIDLGRGLHSARVASDVAARELGLERWRKEVVFENVRELVAELAPDSRVLFVNGRVREMMGLEPAEIVGRPAAEFLPEASRDVGEKIWRARLEQGPTNEFVELMVQDRNGDPLYLEMTVAEYQQDLEKRYLVIARDVTPRRQAEAERAAHQHELETAVAERSDQLKQSLSRLRDQDRLAAVGTLASGIAHQINNPVGAISAAAEFALLSKEDEHAESVTRESLERILDEAQRAGRIVKSILRFARHESTIKWREDLGSIVRRSVELVRPYVAERGGVLEMRWTHEALPVLMSPIEVEQMMVNLIRNAAESGSPGTKITVSTAASGGNAILEVRDDGRGIEEAARSQLFDPFYTTRVREGGSGLGLSIVHGIVNDHSGRIEIDSEVGRGTCVRIEFPLAADAASGDPGSR